MTKRLGVAQGSFDRLRRFLNTRRVLGLRHRLQLWQATVLPAMTYGILAAGVTKHSLERFHGMYMRHVRAISNSPVHVTNESNMELLRRLGFPVPVDHLLHLVMGRMRGLERLSLLLPSDDVMLAPSLWQWLVDLRGNLSCFSHFYKRDVAGIVPVVDAPFLCNICGHSFSTQASLRLRDSKVRTKVRTKVRKKPVPSLKNLGDRIRERGVDGMPTCKYCLHPFPRWTGLTRHLQLGRCEAYLSRVAAGPEAPALQASVPPLIEHPTFFDDFARRGTQALSQHPAVLAEAASRCCLCRQWFSSPSAYKTHLRRVHVEAWQHFGERSIQRVTEHSLSGPCPYCKATVSAKTKHKCPVLGHIYFAALHHGGRGRTHGTHGDGASNVRASFLRGRPKRGLLPCRRRARARRWLRRRPSTLGQRGPRPSLPRARARVPTRARGQFHARNPAPVHQTVNMLELWKKQKELGKATSPLQVILWAEELGSRASLLLQNSQAMQSAIQGVQTSWNYLAWDAQAKREIKDTTIPPMTHDRLLRRIKTLQDDAKGDIILRGRSTRCYWRWAPMARGSRMCTPLRAYSELAGDILQQGVPQFVCFHRFTLFNPDNRCYQNAVFLAIAWAHARAGEALSSSYRETFFQCARSGGMALRQSTFWMQLTSRWPNPHLQHDAAEFLAHILQQAPVPAFSGSWASYSAGQMRDYHDLGHSPLLLRIGRRRSLQSMIQGWHADPESRNSLLQAPRLLIVQIMRFSFTEGSVVRKSQISFRLPQLLRFPCQTDADAPVEWLSYSISCGALHLGGTPQSGHYRSFFISESEVRDSSRYWLTEDSQTLQAADEEAMQLVQRNCYLLFCQRQSV